MFLAAPATGLVKSGGAVLRVRIVYAGTRRDEKLIDSRLKRSRRTCQRNDQRGFTHSHVRIKTTSNQLLDPRNITRFDRHLHVHVRATAGSRQQAH